jgi:hypothetical protein
MLYLITALITYIKDIRGNKKREEKKEMAKHYSEVAPDNWTVNHLLAYIGDEHKQRFNVEYAPWRSWSVERGMIANLIGTRSKPGKYSVETVKHFVDICLREYKPTPSYPGISFGFMWTYRSNVWQQVLLAEVQRNNRKEAIGQQLSEAEFNELI